MLKKLPVETVVFSVLIYLILWPTVTAFVVRQKQLLVEEHFYDHLSLHPKQHECPLLEPIYLAIFQKIL